VEVGGYMAIGDIETMRGGITERREERTTMEEEV
jgi:hypothetical protein